MEQIFQQNAKFQKERDNFLNNLDLLFRLIKQLTDIASYGHGNPNIQKSGDFLQFLQAIFGYLCNSTDLFGQLNNQIQVLCALLKAIGETMAIFTHPRCDISAYKVNTMGKSIIINAENVPNSHCHIIDCISPKLALHRHVTENLGHIPNVGEVFIVDMGESGLCRAVRNDLIFEREPRTWKLCLIDTGKVIEIPYHLGKITDENREPLNVVPNLRELLHETVYFHVQAIENNILLINISLKNNSKILSISESSPCQIPLKNEIIDLLSDNDEAETAVDGDAVKDDHRDYCNPTTGSDDDDTEVHDDNEGMYSGSAGSNELHQQTHQLVCDVCGHEFGTKVAIESHMSLHTRKTKNSKSTKERKRQYICQFCEKAFRFNCKLKRHERIHTNEKPFSCEICKKAFNLKSILIVHKKIHTGEKQHKCNVCGKAFIERNNLVRHLETHKINCKLCGQNFGQSDDLKHHIQRQHGQTAFICSFCRKMFKTEVSLQQHLNLHTKKNKFPCKICGKIYFNQSGLRAHSKIHSGEKFFCRICGRDFSQKSSLKFHLKIHTGVKTFVCVICKREFISNYRLKIHSRVHTKN